MEPELARDLQSRKYRILAVVMLGAILGPIDASIVNVILPTITRTFGASMAAAQWVAMAYLVTVGSLVLFYGRLGDIWGYRRVFLSGLLGFVAASCLCAGAPTIHWLVACRAVQGLAAGMMMSVPLAILTGTFPAAERGKALGLFATSISVGLAVGPSLGGLLAAAFGWRAAFLINLPIGLAAFALARRSLPDMRGRAGRMDLLGAGTALAALASFLVFVNRAQEDGLDRVTGPGGAAAGGGGGGGGARAASSSRCSSCAYSATPRSASGAWRRCSTSCPSTSSSSSRRSCSSASCTPDPAGWA